MQLKAKLIQEDKNEKIMNKSYHSVYPFLCVSEPMQDMLKTFGFNSLQLYDIWQKYFDVGWHIPPEKWGDWSEEWSKKADTAGC